MSSVAETFQELHRLLAHAANLRYEIDRAPKSLKAQQDRLAKQEQEVKDFHEATRKVKVGIHEKEVSLKAKNQLIEKYEGQINAVTSKKEFDALKLEIANAKKECQRIEDQILESMTESDTRAARQPQMDAELQSAKQKTAQLIDDIQTRRHQFTSELAEVHKQIEAVEANLTVDVRPLYERQKGARGEDALAAVTNRTCQACQTTITAQAHNELLSGRLFLCKSCGRILYLRDAPKNEE